MISGQTDQSTVTDTSSVINGQVTEQHVLNKRTAAKRDEIGSYRICHIKQDG